MSEKKKRNIIICSLCGVLLLMAVGYAAFNTLLTINGTASITSSWDIKITNITEGTKVGDASSAEDPTYEDLEATFSVNLVSPGDSIEYNVTVENQGSLNAQLEKININKQISSAINITYSGIEAGETLNSGSDTTFTIKVEYNTSITSQPKDTTSTFKMTLDYVEEGKAGETSASTTGTLTMGGQTVSVIDDGSDGLYEDPVEPGRYVYAGANPNNYITFNGEDAGWRIISIESNGELKIMRASALSDKGVFDLQGFRDIMSGGAGGTYCSQGESGCNVWAKTNNYVNGNYSGTVTKDAELNMYLNGKYYNSISIDQDKIVTNHIWYYGGNKYDESDLSALVVNEKKASATSNIGIISLSDFFKANSNRLKCGTGYLIEESLENSEKCVLTNWMYSYNDSYWTITPSNINAYTVNIVYIISKISTMSFQTGVHYAQASTSFDIVPSLYLKPTIKLTGSGSQDDPYKIESVS